MPEATITTNAAPLAEVADLVTEIAALAEDHQLRRHVEPKPCAEYFEKVYALLVLVADHQLSDGTWPRSSWVFLQQLNTIARAIEMIPAADWATGGHWHQCRQPDSVITSWITLPEATVSFEADCELAPPRQVQLETIEELREQGLTASQLANLYNWKDRFGNLDVRRAQQALAGEIEVPPQFTTLPPEADGLPMVQPSLATVEKLAAGQAPQF